MMPYRRNNAVAAPRRLFHRKAEASDVLSMKGMMTLGTRSGADPQPGAEAPARRTLGVMAVLQCPKCELKFTSESELDWHLRNDHDDPDTLEPEVPQRGPVG